MAITPFGQCLHDSEVGIFVSGVELDQLIPACEAAKRQLGLSIDPSGIIWTGVTLDLRWGNFMLCGEATVDLTEAQARLACLRVRRKAPGKLSLEFIGLDSRGISGRDEWDGLMADCETARALRES